MNKQLSTAQEGSGRVGDDAVVVVYGDVRKIFNFLLCMLCLFAAAEISIITGGLPIPTFLPTYLPRHAIQLS